MISPEEDPTPEELAEAEALARTLEDGEARPSLPADAWQAASLLRTRERPLTSVPPMPVAVLRELAKRKKSRLPVWIASSVALAASVLIAVMVTGGGGSRKSAPAMEAAPQRSEAGTKASTGDSMPADNAMESEVQSLRSGASPERCARVCAKLDEACVKARHARCAVWTEAVRAKCTCPSK